jgi:diaminobutyrate acetyltransferase
MASHDVATESVADTETILGSPEMADGAAMWRIARDSKKLDLNSSYAYLLWCRDFAGGSVIARHGEEVVGFVAGYRRPDAMDTVVVWQLAVDSSRRGTGLGAAMLEHLVDRLAPQGVTHLDTTITADNTASIKLFESLARRRRTRITRSPLFEANHFPDGHDAEDLYHIGPFPHPSSSEGLNPS